MANFAVLNEVAHPEHPEGDYRLFLQRVMLHFWDGQPSQMGYRTMWKDPRGKMGSRPCRVDSLHDMFTLQKLAIEQGWGNFDGGIHGLVRAPLAVSIGDFHASIDGYDGAGLKRPPRWVTLNGVNIDLNAEGPA